MLEDFEQYLVKEKRYSKHTCLAYIMDIEQFFEFAQIREHTKPNLQEISSKLVRAWLVSLLKNNLAPKSVNRKLSSNRGYFKYLMVHNAISSNPFLAVHGPKVAKRLPEFIQKNEVEIQKVDALFENDLFGLRDRIIFETFYQTGIRLSELIGIKESDVSSNGLRVLGKRNKERNIALGQSLFNQIQGLIQAKLNSDVICNYVFFTDSGKKMYPKFVYRKINYYLSNVTTINRKSPHVMRHTFATHLLNEGVPIEVLKEILGHASLAATQVYTHNSFEQINSIYKSAHPREHNPKNL